MRTRLIGTFLVLSTVAAVGQDRVWTELTSSDATQSLAYSACSPEECFGEAVTHVLGCSAQVGQSFFEIISHSRGLEVVEAVTSFAGSSATVTLTAGEARQSAAVEQMTLSHNAMNGAWDVLLTGYEFAGLFKAVAQGSGDQVVVEIAGLQFDLAPNKEAHSRLKALAVLCSPQT